MLDRLAREPYVLHTIPVMAPRPSNLCCQRPKHLPGVPVDVEKGKVLKPTEAGQSLLPYAGISGRFRTEPELCDSNR